MTKIESTPQDVLQAHVIDLRKTADMLVAEYPAMSKLAAEFRLAADEVDEAIAAAQDEISRLRELAGCVYAGPAAVHDLPEHWLDTLYAASEGRPFDCKRLLPYEAAPDDVRRDIALDMRVALSSGEFPTNPVSNVQLAEWIKRLETPVAAPGDGYAAIQAAWDNWSANSEIRIPSTCFAAGWQAHAAAPTAPPVAVDGEPTITIQEAWEAAGGNPGIKASKQELLNALRSMDEAIDEIDTSPATSAPGVAGGGR